MILVSIKLPEEIPWYRALRRGMVAVMAENCWKRAPFVVYRTYAIRDRGIRGLRYLRQSPEFSVARLGNATTGSFGLVMWDAFLGVGMCSIDAYYAREDSRNRTEFCWT